MPERKMVFNVRKYNNELDMMIEVGNVMAALVRNGYECRFRYEDCGIYVLEFAYSMNNDYGEPFFMLVNEEEADEIRYQRENPQDCEACQISTPEAENDESWPPALS